ncbi:G patch domain-containing protein 4 [Anopheles cruzii]|uniref:G patch domain-containing protein 4 n=1 Tax=Anopheles cruzii TaxID=68878 RepID=UPI0022EC7AAF|nr:G patch domain-containing protein 4 [Anopheles cruzii]
MDFAKNVLQKYGWKEGDALGKNANGITAPIKASLKFNSAGLGANPAKDLTNNWWERVYNDAAGNIAVNKQASAGIAPHESAAVQFRQLDVDAVEISTKGYSVQKLKKKAQTAGASSRYGTNFLKASTLLGGTEREEAAANHISTEDIELAPVKTLTDEELFAACGGRTAHKGARHGLKLSGKLARIDEQNTRLLEQLESKSFETVIRSNDWQIQRSKNGRKKSKKQQRNEQRWLERGDGASGAVNGTGHEGDEEVKDMVHHADYVVAKNRKKKKNHEQRDQELAKGVISMFTELPEEEDGGAAEQKPQQAVAAPIAKAKKKSKITSRKQPTMEDELDRLGEKIRKLDHGSVVIKKKDRSKKVKRKSGADTNDDDTAMADPAARYRKDYRPDAKQNNRLLKSSVPHEVPMVPVIKPKLLLRSDSSDEEEEDVVDRVNAEQSRYWKKMRATVPRINIIKPTEDECLVLGQELKERHKCEVKRVANRTASGKRKKSRRKERQLSQLADSLSKKL